MNIWKLGMDEERGYGLSHHIQLTETDLTNTTAGAAQTIPILSVPAGYYIDNVAFILTTPFQNTADTAFNTSPFVFGDASQTNRLIASSETNANGSYVSGGVANSSYVPVGIVYNTATQLNVIFTPTSGKALANLNAGQLDIFLRMKNLARLVS